MFSPRRKQARGAQAKYAFPDRVGREHRECLSGRKPAEQVFGRTLKDYSSSAYCVVLHALLTPSPPPMYRAPYRTDRVRAAQKDAEIRGKFGSDKKMLELYNVI